MADLTGNVLIALAGIPTAVINSSICGVIEEAFEHGEAVEEIYGALNGITGLLNEDFVDLGAESHKTIQGLRRTPSAALGTSPASLSSQDESRALRILQYQNVRYFIMAGAGEAMRVAHRIQESAQAAGYELRVMGIPMSPDNDLPHTDHVPGYGSAARWLAVALRDIERDNAATYTMQAVHIVETAGATGWTAAATALARDHQNAAPHLIYTPEVAFNPDAFLADVQDVYERLNRAVIVVSEGLKTEQNEPVNAVSLSQLLAERLRLSSELIKPGILPRSSQVCVSRVDAEEAHVIGRKAVRLMVDGYTGYVMTVQRDRESSQYKPIYGTARLEDVAGMSQPLPRHYLNERGNDVTDAFLEYVRPLIGGPLPEYVTLEKVPVDKKRNGAD